MRVRVNSLSVAFTALCVAFSPLRLLPAADAAGALQEPVITRTREEALAMIQVRDSYPSGRGVPGLSWAVVQRRSQGPRDCAEGSMGPHGARQPPGARQQPDAQRATQGSLWSVIYARFAALFRHGTPGRPPDELGPPFTFSCAAACHDVKVSVRLPLSPAVHSLHACRTVAACRTALPRDAGQGRGGLRDAGIPGEPLQQRQARGRPGGVRVRPGEGGEECVAMQLRGHSGIVTSGY